MLDRRNLIVIVACAVGLCWVTTQLQNNSKRNTHSTLNRFGEPGLLPLYERQSSRSLRPHYDRNVRPASAAILAPLAVLGQDEPNVSITELEQDKLVWPVNNQVRRVLLASPPTVTVLGTMSEGLDLANVSVIVENADGTRSDPVYDARENNDSGWAKDVVISANAVRLVPLVKVVTPDPGGGEPTTTIRRFTPVNIVPSSTEVEVPRMRSLSNNSQVFPTKPFVVGDPELSGVSVYSRYLRLSGENVLPETALDFLVFKQATNAGGAPIDRFILLDTIRIPTRAVQRTDDGRWDVVLTLPIGSSLPSGATAILQVVATKPGTTTHRFGINRLKFTNSSPPDGLKAPAFHATDAATKVSSGDGTVTKIDKAFYSNRPTVTLKGNIGSNANAPADGRLAVLLGSGENVLTSLELGNSDTTWKTDVELPVQRDNQIRVAWSLGDELHEISAPIVVHVRTAGPEVVSVEPRNFVSTPNQHKVTVTFDEELADLSSPDNTKFKLAPATTGTAVAFVAETPPALNTDRKSVVVNYMPFSPDELKFTIAADAVTDLFGNQMEKEQSFVLVKPIGTETPTTSRGISGATGPYIPYGEYTKPRPFIDGFNPSDHVETRVSRLYYFRDAHRVAQIINRDAKSYNRAAVDMQQQLADKARTVADQATDERRAKEREAVRAAERTREAEREQQQAEANAQRAAAEAANANAQIQQNNAMLNDPMRTLSDSEKKRLNDDIERATAARTSLDEVFRSQRRRADAAANKVQALREKEAEATERWQTSIAVEDRARENQFRREVAAAHADPDTYAPGKPGSEDPVRQVSVSVIGEGLIQLRGPIKGINIIRTMINQIDAPVGQVRVGVHTVQINGEKGDRMEIVAGKIQRYIDHSRFLTLQSAEMLRKAIVQVAAQRAMELGNVPGMTQEQRDRSYLYSFFGQDFIHELEAMDSEFLGSGNKLLSLHSMDSTSLASAMFIMALAKNTTRMEILQTFEAMMQSELPMAEQSYFEAGLTCDGKEKLFGKYCKEDEFCLLSQNARFQSIRGMFDVEIQHDDTMTPVQREFVRLAQIFKSRLIVEMELKQRIMERAVIEERLGNREKELTDARKNESAANDAKRRAEDAVRAAQKGAIGASRQLLSVLQGPKRRAHEAEVAIQSAQHTISLVVDDKIKTLVEIYLKEIARTAQDSSKRGQKEALRALANGDSMSKVVLDFINNNYRAGKPPLEKVPPLFPDDPETKKAFELTRESAGAIISSDLNRIFATAKEIGGKIDAFRLDDEHQKIRNVTATMVRRVESRQKGDEIDSLYLVRDILENYKAIADYKVGQLMAQYEAMSRILAALGAADPDVQEIYQSWLNIEQELDSELNDSERADSKPAFDGAQASFQTLLEKDLDYEFALRRAGESRRPLDHKKFLDMLVDEMEDKYIELLEGTRAHTANIDAYIKRLMTSLDDDFNTQFYFPTFRKVREASQMWDVQMGQVETTNVLANNRAFAKVSPQATMEFDLPKRDIVIAEAMNGAKAMMNDFGALAQDPTFLAMAQMRGGAPTSTQIGGASGGQSTVRNVLPGMSSDTAESVMSQQGPGGSQFGAAMEALIPDPAIYKFETGTGWEIRPVIQPDGQAVVFDFNYMYTTNIREPVRADEKHLGRVKRHFVDTDVQLSNFELREISRYTVALKASRTSRGVPLFEDIPVVGTLFRPLPSDESSLQQNVILGQATIFPTLFDLMGLRWAPVVADLDPLRLSNDEFIVRNRRRVLMNRVFDHSSSKVDEFLRIPDGERRMDLYRSQETLPSIHPNGYQGPGANLRDSKLQEGYFPTRRPETQFVPGESNEGSLQLRNRHRPIAPTRVVPLEEVPLSAPEAGQSDQSSTRRRPQPSPGVAQANYRTQTGAPRAAGKQTEDVTTQPPTAKADATSLQRLPLVRRMPHALPRRIPSPVGR